MRLVPKLFILQNVAQISVPVNMCTCHLVAGCTNHAFSTGSKNIFLKENQFFFCKSVQLPQGPHILQRHDPATWPHTASSNPKHECNLNIPDILNKRNDGDSEHCKSDKYSNIKSNGVSDSAVSNNRYKDGGTMGIFPYS
jgi:hypothetical protein